MSLRRKNDRYPCCSCARPMTTPQTLRLLSKATLLSRQFRSAPESMCQGDIQRTPGCALRVVATMHLLAVEGEGVEAFHPLSAVCLCERATAHS